MDLLAMRTSLRAMIGSPDTGSVPDAELTEVLNISYREIGTTYRFHGISRVRSTFNTVIGTSSYALDSTDLILHSVWNKTTGREIKKIDYLNIQKYDDSVAYPTVRGLPTRYYRDGGNILLFAVPDAVYTIELITTQYPTALAANGDTPILPEAWHRGIVLHARWQFFDNRGDYPKAQYGFNAWNAWVATKPNEYDEENAAFQHSADVEPGFIHRNRSLGFDYD